MPWAPDPEKIGEFEKISAEGGGVLTLVYAFSLFFAFFSKIVIYLNNYLSYHSM